MAARLRAAGAVILGKTNLSEWANFRGFSSTSGWSGQGGLTRNPYVLDRNPCGSSSGSAASVAANLTAAGLGTETDGSIICPASINGVVGIKPTVGLTSRAGVIPISHTQDTVGPHARTVADAAAVLERPGRRRPARSADRGERRQVLDRLHPVPRPATACRGRASASCAARLHRLQREDRRALRRGAHRPWRTPARCWSTRRSPDDRRAAQRDQSETIVLIYEFKRDLNAYLATRTGVPIHTLADAIAFNSAHAGQELQCFGQELFELAQDEIFTEEQYLDALERGPRLAGAGGDRRRPRRKGPGRPGGAQRRPAWTIDLVNGDHFLGASTCPAAVAGYPIINVPMGVVVRCCRWGSASWPEPTASRR